MISFKKYKYPVALTSKGWKEWRENTKKEFPVQWFLRETLPDIFDDIWRTFYRPLNDAYWWVRYRTINRNHIIDTKIGPGNPDEDELMLYAIFSILEDFVEKGMVRKAQWCGLKGTALKSPAMEWFEDDLKMVNDESSGFYPGDEGYGKEHSQAASTREILFLYNWWKERQKRGDAGDVSGLYNTEWLWDLDTPLTSEQKEVMDRHNKLEADWHQEDIDMSIRLMKIRRHLWS